MHITYAQMVDQILKSLAKEVEMVENEVLAHLENAVRSRAEEDRGGFFGDAFGKLRVERMKEEGEIQRLSGILSRLSQEIDYWERVKAAGAGGPQDKDNVLRYFNSITKSLS